jgi:hypothetical protein
VLQDNAATDRFLSRASRRLVQRLLPYLPMAGEAEVRHYARVAAKVLLDFTLERWGELERNGYVSVLSDASVAGLSWYVEEPLYRQIAAERNGQVPGDVTFVFGHTHKPFEDALPLDHYALPVTVFNTGGWVLDEPDMMRAEGAAAVLVDADLNVVSLRLFNDPVNDVLVPVSVRAAGTHPEQDNPLLEATKRAVANGQSVWDRFTDAAASALQARRLWLIRHFDLGLATPAAKG